MDPVRSRAALALACAALVQLGGTRPNVAAAQDIGHPSVATRAGARTSRPPRFAPAQIGVLSPAELRRVLAGDTYRADFGARALRHAGKPAVQLARHIQRLMPEGTAAFAHVLIAPTHVALVRADGSVDVIRRSDAEAQVATGRPFEAEKIDVGRGARGASLRAEVGPNGTVYLYRQLPLRAEGTIASTYFQTSFALSRDDAMHPFGPAGKTVRAAVPKEVFDRAVDGSAGAVGWNDFGGGYNTGLEVMEEVQLPSGRIRDLFP